jgi:hypothetical protein
LQAMRALVDRKRQHDGLCNLEAGHHGGRRRVAAGTKDTVCAGRSKAHFSRNPKEAMANLLLAQFESR